MKKSNLLMIVLVVLLGSMLGSACSTAAAEPVQALGATDAPAEVAAPAATEAPLSVPAEAPAAGSPTPSRVEFSVQNASLEVKVLDVEKPYRVNLGMDPYLGTELTFTPGAGSMFLGLGVKVKSLTGADLPMKWTDVYLVNKYQDKWYPSWGAYQPTNAAMDPLTVEIVKYDEVHPDFDPDAHFYAADNGFMRVIFRVPRDNLYYFFGLADLPQIEINWRYY
jgi:hypothetical protein